ncbi:hypothetical protein [Amycolatopsis pigmentata]|uniref:Uncharacterized protein n=1 Tax=Amycolatopsis pigmentata TaxID=450801 RepID=A0ABW5G634_9PSEU
MRSDGMSPTRRKVAAAVLTLGVAGGLIAGQGVASASTADWVNLRTYPTKEQCVNAGNAGFPAGLWMDFECYRESDGYLLSVSP